jgi:hypothetical protein
MPSPRAKMFAPPPGSTAIGVRLRARPLTTSFTVPSPPRTTTRSTPSCAAPRATCVAWPWRFVSTVSSRVPAASAFAITPWA